MASHSQSQESTIEDQRFAELLKPIKDLTQNWEVPLAEIMSEYMDVLQQVRLFANHYMYIENTHLK